MSAKEVLEQVKSLPLSEREKFFASVHELETAIGNSSSANRGKLARQLMGAGRQWLQPGSDPIADLIQERYQDDLLDQSDEQG